MAVGLLKAHLQHSGPFMLEGFASVRVFFSGGVGVGWQWVADVLG